MKKSPFLVFILPTLGLLAVGQVITRNFAKSPPVSLHSTLKRHGLTQNAVLAEKEVSAPVESAGEKERDATIGAKAGAETVPERETSPTVAAYQVRASAGPNYDKLIIPFVKQVKAEELIEAEETLASIENELPLSIRSALHLALDSAREARKVKATAKVEREKREQALAMVEMEKELRVRSVAEAREETEKVDNARLKVEQHLVEIQSESADRLNSSIEELNQAAEAARTAALEAEKSIQEAARLIADNARMKAQTKPPVKVEPGKPVAKAEPKVAPPVKVIELPETESIRFALNSSEVADQFVPVLDRVTSQLKKESAICLELRGYTDSLGDPAYNAALSRSRSENVKKDLVGRGISAERIKVLPFGSAKSTKGNSENQRRVDLVFVLRKDQIKAHN